MNGSRTHERIKRLRNAALEQQKGRCLYCKAPLEQGEATAEHRIPRSRGGGDCRSNIAAACEPCNTARADVPLDYFYKLIDRSYPPRGAHTSILMIWATRRLWRRTERACARIVGASR